MNTNKFIPLKELVVYKLSRELSNLAWEIYSNLSYEEKKLMGDQFLRSIDSIGANIAEGYFRYHYLDKIRFFYISRGSLSEAFHHWADLMRERNIIDTQSFNKLKEIHDILEVKLNNFIAVTSGNAKKYD